MTHRREYLEAAVRTAKVFAKAQKRNRPIYYRNYLDGRAETDSPAIIPIPIWPVPLSRSGHARSTQGKVWMVNRDVGTSFSLRFLADYYNFIDQQ